MSDENKNIIQSLKPIPVAVQELKLMELRASEETENL